MSSLFTTYLKQTIGIRSICTLDREQLRDVCLCNCLEQSCAFLSIQIFWIEVFELQNLGSRNYFHVTLYSEEDFVDCRLFAFKNLRKRFFKDVYSNFLDNENS